MDTIEHVQKVFKTIEDAHAWIATQGSSKDFWTGIQQKTEEIAP